MSRFKKGEKVWYGRGEYEKQLVVAKVHDNPLIPVYQYTFEAPNDGFACGEQSIRATRDGRDLTLRECFKSEDDDREVSVRFNTIASALRHPIEIEGSGVENLYKDEMVKFKPDFKLCKWLIEYANGRLIIDVGSGQGHLVNMLNMCKNRGAMGIEPNFNLEFWLKFRQTRNKLEDININEILPRKIEDCKTIIEGMGKDKVLLIFARPSSGDYVRSGIRNMPYGMEALYIAKPTDLVNYDDLGRFGKNKVLLNHEGISEDNEVIYSIKR